MKRKILFILHVPPPIHGASMMGRYIMESRKINETFECSYINLTTASKIDDISYFSMSKIFSFLRLYWKVLAAVARKRYDLCYMTINSRGAGFYKELVIVFILKMFRCPIAFHYHNKGVTKGQSNWILNRLYRFQFRNERAILLSRTLYPDVRKYLQAEMVYYCANGVPEMEKTVPGERDIKSAPEMLFLSNMIREKGVFVLLESCKLLNERNVKFTMNFIGAWANIREKDFNLYVEKNNLRNVVKYLGEKYGDEKDNFLRSADIFIHPTLNDCFPLAVIEAMQHALPVIASDEAALSEMIENNVSGYIIPKNDATKLTEKMESLIKNHVLRKEMGKRAYEKYRNNYTIEMFELNFIQALNRIAADIHSS